MKFKDAAELYFDIKQGLIKPSSFTNMKRLYRDHISEYFDDIELDKITSREMQKFYNLLANKTSGRNSNERLSEHTIKDIVGLAKTICYNAMAEGEMQECRFKLKKPYGMRQVENGQAEYLSEEDYKKVMSICLDCDFNHNGKAKIMTVLALTTGMRIGEICGLRWEDVDLENGYIKVNCTVQRIIREDGSSYIHIGDPKSQTSKRKVLILEAAKQVLLQYKSHNKIANERLYVIGGEKPNEPRTIRQAYARFLKNIDVPYIHPHALRHTFCTYSIANGCDIKTISQLLGHSKTDITLDTYTHITQKQIDKTTNKLNEIFSTGNTSK